MGNMLEWIEKCEATKIASGALISTYVVTGHLHLSYSWLFMDNFVVASEVRKIVHCEAKKPLFIKNNPKILKFWGSSLWSALLQSYQLRKRASFIKNTCNPEVVKGFGFLQMLCTNPGGGVFSVDTTQVVPHRERCYWNWHKLSPLKWEDRAWH